MSLKIDELRRFPLLAGLSDSDLQNLAGAAVLQRFPSQRVILRQNEIPAYIVIVVNGQIQSSVLNEEGRVISLAFINADEVIGWECAIDGMPLSQTLTTTKATDLLLIPLPIAKALLASPWVTAEVLRIFTKSIRRLTDSHRVLGLPNAYQRVYSKLLQLTTPKTDQPQPTHLPKQQEIAVMVNTSRETVSRAIQALIKQGVLVKSGQQIVIQDANRLKQLVVEHSEK